MVSILGRVRSGCPSQGSSCLPDLGHEAVHQPTSIEPTVASHPTAHVETIRADGRHRFGYIARRQTPGQEHRHIELFSDAGTDGPIVAQARAAKGSARKARMPAVEQDCIDERGHIAGLVCRFRAG